MTTVRAPDLAGHEAILEAIVEHLVAHDDGQVDLPSLGWLRVSAASKRPRFAYFEPETTTDPLRSRKAGPTRPFPPSPELDGFAAALRTRLDAGEGAHVPGLGTFAVYEGELHMFQADVLRARVAGRELAPMDEGALDQALARFAAEPFGVRELQELLAPCPGAAEPEDDVLVDLPAGLPKLLRAALARSAELGNKDRFGFLIPMRREWAWSDFARSASGPPDVFFVSDAPPRHVAAAGARAWVLPLADLGTEDPTVVWCLDHASLAASPHRARLSTWLRLFALETVLGPLDPPRAARVAEAVRTACPEVATSWPERWVGEAPDPWLRQVVLTW